MSKQTRNVVIGIAVAAGLGGLAVGIYFLVRRARGASTPPGGSGAAAGTGLGAAGNLFNSIAGGAADYLRGGDGAGRTSQGGTAGDGGRQS